MQPLTTGGVSSQSPAASQIGKITLPDPTDEVYLPNPISWFCLNPIPLGEDGTDGNRQPCLLMELLVYPNLIVDMDTPTHTYLSKDSNKKQNNLNMKDKQLHFDPFVLSGMVHVHAMSRYAGQLSPKMSPLHTKRPLCSPKKNVTNLQTSKPSTEMPLCSTGTQGCRAM